MNRTGPNFPPKQAAEGSPQRKAQRSGFALERRNDGVSELCPAGRSEGYETRDDKVARRELRPATQILRAGNTAKSNKYASPVMGVLEGGRHGGGEALPNHRLRPTPGGSQGELPQRGKRGWPGPLVTFWPSRKSLAARRRRNSPAKRAAQRPDEGIGPYEKDALLWPSHPPSSGAPDPIPSGLRPSSLLLLAFGHFPLTGGIGPLTRGVGPQGEGFRSAGGENL